MTGGFSQRAAPAGEPCVTFARVAVDRDALCIECRACRRRSVLTRESHPGLIHEGNKRRINEAKFRCSNLACGSSDVRLYNARTMQEAEMFKAADPLPADREIAEKS
jgi:hypothetical protein